MKTIRLLAVLLFVSVTTFAQTWSVDKAHAKLGFTATHMMISDVEGWFKGFDAKVTSSKADFTDAVIELTADVNSINTDNDRRDAHLKSPDYFDAVKYAMLTFKSTSFKKVDGKKYKLTGDLTMRGVTKPVVLDVIFNGTNSMPNSTKKIAGFKVTGTLKRSDFGIGASAPSAIISDEITLIANMEFNENLAD